MKYIITESQYNKGMDRFITYLLKPQEMKTSDQVPDSIFWVKDGKVIAEIQEQGTTANRKYFWCRRDIWDSILFMLSDDWDGVEQHIKEWLDKHYNLGNLIPSYPSIMTQTSWESIK